MWDGAWVGGLRRGKVNRIWTTYGSEEDKPPSPSGGRGACPAGSLRNGAGGGLVPVSPPGGLAVSSSSSWTSLGEKEPMPSHSCVNLILDTMARPFVGPTHLHWADKDAESA